MSLAWAAEATATAGSQAADALAAAESGPVVTATLGLLVVMSIATWAILGLKLWVGRRIAGADGRFLSAFYRSHNLDQIADAAREEPLSGPARLFLAAFDEMESLREHGAHARLTGVDGLIRLAERALDRAITVLRVERERYLTTLATVASGAPFIGLFGTVWGIMNAFEGIGRMGSASLAVVAPGISEALIATAMGLFAAIPAAMFYNFFQRRMDEEEAELAGFRLELLNLLEAYVFPDLDPRRGSTPPEPDA